MVVTMCIGWVKKTGKKCTNKGKYYGHCGTCLKQKENLDKKSILMPDIPEEVRNATAFCHYLYSNEINDDLINVHFKKWTTHSWVKKYCYGKNFISDKGSMRSCINKAGRDTEYFVEVYMEINNNKVLFKLMSDNTIIVSYSKYDILQNIIYMKALHYSLNWHNESAENLCDCVCEHMSVIDLKIFTLKTFHTNNDVTSNLLLDIEESTIIGNEPQIANVSLDIDSSNINENSVLNIEEQIIETQNTNLQLDIQDQNNNEPYVTHSLLNIDGERRIHIASPLFNNEYHSDIESDGTCDICLSSGIDDINNNVEYTSREVNYTDESRQIKIDNFTSNINNIKNIDVNDHGCNKPTTKESIKINLFKDNLNKKYCNIMLVDALRKDIDRDNKTILCMDTKFLNTSKEIYCSDLGYNQIWISETNIESKKNIKESIKRHKLNNVVVECENIIYRLKKIFEEVEDCSIYFDGYENNLHQILSYYCTYKKSGTVVFCYKLPNGKSNPDFHISHDINQKLEEYKDSIKLINYESWPTEWINYRNIFTYKYNKSTMIFYSLEVNFK